MQNTKYPIGNEEKFNKFLVEQYLKFGSVDEVLKKHKFDLPVSYASYQRVLDRWGIVKAAGPNNKLGESIDFLTRLVEENIPLEKLYKKMPSSFKTSAASLYRVLSYVKEGITRRIATALIVTPHNSQTKMLIVKDVSTPRIDLGKQYGSWTIPTTFSKIGDPREEAILRVMQQEIFSNLAIEKKIPNSLIPKRPKPFMFLDIADVRIEVFHIRLPKNLSDKKNLSSFKVTNHTFATLSQIKNKKNTRKGVVEIAGAYIKYKNLINKNYKINPLQIKAMVNDKVISLITE